MSDKIKFPRALAMTVAENLVEGLRPTCQRIEIAGSLRRGKSEVGDIEILFVPRIGQHAVDMFLSEAFSKAALAIDVMLDSGILARRPGKLGTFAWGRQNKLAFHTASGIPVDFFETTNENWAVSLVIRTGSKETNLRLTTGAQRLNRTLKAYGSGVEDRATGKLIPANTEEEVFTLCGIPYLPPEKR